MRFSGFVNDIDCLGGLSLHPVSEFVSGNSCSQTCVFFSALKMQAIEVSDSFEFLLLGTLVGALGGIEIENWRTIAAEGGALKRGGHPACPPISGPAQRVARIAHDHTRGEVGILGTEAVTDP